MQLDNSNQTWLHSVLCFPFLELILTEPGIKEESLFLRQVSYNGAYK